MSSDKTRLRFRRLVKITKPFHLPILIGMFGLFQWAFGCEIFQPFLVVITFVIFLLMVPFIGLVDRLFKLLSIGKKTIFRDKEGKFTHRSLFGSKCFFFCINSLVFYYFLGKFVEILQRQEQFLLGVFLLVSAVTISFIVLSLYVLAVTLLYFIEYDDDFITWRNAYFVKVIYSWGDLEEVKMDKDDQHTILHFKSSGRIRVLAFCEAKDQIINFAKKKLNNA